MPTPVLLAYATSYGSTEEVAAAVADTLRESGLALDIQPMREVRSLDGYGAAVLGFPLYMFRLHKDARRFLKRQRKALSERPVAVFALGPTHDPHDQQEWQDSRGQLEKGLAKYPWLKPVALEMFGGKYDPAKLRFPINVLAGAEPASDIRDWTTIREWAGSLPAIFEPTS